MDTGYYRLGFYLFPFEKAYPKLKKRSHEYKEGTTLQGAVPYIIMILIYVIFCSVT